MATPETLYFEIYQNGALVRTDRRTGNPIKLGSHAGADVAIDDPGVGRLHALIENGEAGVFVIDLGSGRGTCVNGVRVNKREIHHRDRITLGGTEVVVLRHDRMAAGVTEARARMAIDLSKDWPCDEVLYARRFLARPAATDGSVEIAVLYNDFVLTEEIYAPTKNITVGSRDGCTFVVAHPSVGDAHTLVTGGESPALHIADGMTGELYVGSERRRLSKGESLPLGADTRAKIVVGALTFFIHRSTRPRLTLPWERREAAPLLFGLFSAGVHALLWLLVTFLPPGVGGISLDTFEARDRFVQLLVVETPEPDLDSYCTIDEVEGGERVVPSRERVGGDTAVVDADRHVALDRGAPDGDLELAQAREAIQDRGALAVLSSAGPTAMFGAGISGADALVAIGAMSGPGVGYGSRGLAGQVSDGGRGRFGGRGPLGAGGFGIRRLHVHAERSQRGAPRGITHEPNAIVEPAGDALIDGQLDRETIARVIREHRNEVRACYEAELRADPELEGLVKVAFVIAPDGQVAGARISESTLGNDAVAQCIANRARRWRFPAPGGGGTVNVNYPFVLSVG